MSVVKCIGRFAVTVNGCESLGVPSSALGTIMEVGLLGEREMLNVPVEGLPQV